MSLIGESDVAGKAPGSLRCDVRHVTAYRGRRAWPGQADSMRRSRATQVRYKHETRAGRASQMGSQAAGGTAPACDTGYGEKPHEKASSPGVESGVGVIAAGWSVRPELATDVQDSASAQAENVSNTLY